MKNAINWKLFFILLAASFIATLMVLPYSVALSSVPGLVFTPLIIIAQIIQALVLFSVAIFFGLYLAKRMGFGLPIIEGALKGEAVGDYLRSILGLSIGLGVLGGILIILLSFLFPSLSITFLKAEVSVATWKGFLASFYGGIGEEILFRLFLMTLFVWVTFKIKKTPDGRPTNVGIWVSIILTTVLFGLGHLGITSALTTITPLVILRAVLLNGVSVIFGWLYWKKGLESAMIAHFSADIVIHVITPRIASFYV